ncbi:hypothetical protein J7355_13205 [Endozoicomonas sp. G2_2]|uniref:hypothetical protein n=1 Tax=Endozoicomonas sp. G2_2 TaxID=2821092 RepID=UPI001ADD315B|nr:hypothetical protein [Endozoicomonas sp. G2_2]MBO9471052.1 hypothetical protein [Endozoicomonas sp. G2_2]
MDAYSRFHAATTRLREVADLQSVTPETGACACCGRPWASVEDSALAIPYVYGSGFAKQYLCTTCYSPKIGSFDELGIGSRRGPNKIPVPVMLGMMTGCGAVITSSNQLFLAVNEGFRLRVEDGALAAKGRVYRTDPLSLLMALYSDGRLGDPKEGFVYISNFGRKSLVLMGALRMTTDLRELWDNSDTGASCTDLSALLDVARWARENDHVTQAQKSGFWQPITTAARGKLDQDALTRWLAKTPNARELVHRLPSDPHDRLGLHKKMEKILQAAQ